MTCAYCQQPHGFIGVEECGHAFCEACWYDANRVDICVACEYGLSQEVT